VPVGATATVQVVRLPPPAFIGVRPDSLTVGGRTYPVSDAEATVHQREFTAGAGQNACTLQGVVRGHEMGGTFTGSWIEFAASDLAGTLRKASTAPPSNVLLPINAMVRLRRAGAMQVLCRVDAVGESEVHLGCLPAGLSVGERVSLAMLGGPPCESDLGTGDIIWVEERDARVQFAHQEAPRALAVLLHRARTRLGNPLEVQHPASCYCRLGGPPNQPPVPRAAHRRIS